MRQHRWRTFAFHFFLSALFGAALMLSSSSLANPRYAAFVWDLTSGEVLFARAPDERRFPASLTKMMTLFILFEEVEGKRLTLETPLPVNAAAADQPAVKLGLQAGETITVRDAVAALVTYSANDVAVVIAEAIEGTEEAFARRMTLTARRLGLTGTQFRNASGLPDERQFTTARDMALLGAALQVRFPEYYPLFGTKDFEFRGRTYDSHNRLLAEVEGVDGIKTGYIRASGYNIVTSVRRDDRKIIVVVLGGRTPTTRDAHVIELVDQHLRAAEPGSGYAAEIEAAVRETPSATEMPVVLVGETTNGRAAVAMVRRAQRQHRTLLSGLTPVIEQRGGAVRAGLTGFPSRERAVELCAKLQRRKTSCRVGVL